MANGRLTIVNSPFTIDDYSIPHRCSVSPRVGRAVEETTFPVDHDGLDAPERPSPLPNDISALLEIHDDVFRKPKSFTLQRVRQPLVVKPGSIVGFPHVHMVIEHVYDDLENRCYNG